MKRINIDTAELIEFAKTKSIQQIAHYYNCDRSTISIKLSKLKIKAVPVKHWTVSEQGRQNISQGKKKFYKEHPDKHNWKRNNKFKSVPCEKLKEWLKSKNIEFIDEYTIPESEHNYSLDIAFPDKKIGIEINGNQHYNQDGTLAEYYQKRHNYIESLGWRLYELHFSVCFNLEKIENMIPTILTSENKIDFDYKIYVKPPKVNFCPVCNKEITKYAKHCKKCAPRVCSLILPEKEILEKLIWTKPISRLAKKLKCSDNGLIEHCRRNDIALPPQGYWLRR